MTTQIAVKLPDELVRRVDRLVEDGLFDSRSQLVRRGIELAVSSARTTALDRAYEEGYRRLPESDRELALAQQLALQSIEEEPWDRWW